MRLRFLTSTPWDIAGGSGTYVGINGLLEALRALGEEVHVVSSRLRLPVYTLERILYNETLLLDRGPGWDVTVGFDMDGYRVAGRGSKPHIASLKGVIADELRFERGFTRATMALQARYEALHVRRASLVLTTSEYAASRAAESYGVRPRVVPELIDLGAWRKLLAANPAPPDPARFTVLCVCRFYRRKRIGVLLSAAALLRKRIPGLQVRIVGDGPEAARLRAEWRAKSLQDVVVFAGSVPRASLVAEYNRCDLFCLPSVQEGFGIVFLEAMAAEKPVVAARAAAAPEVARYGILAEPDDPESLASAIECFYRSPERRMEAARMGSSWVEQFDAPRVARLFLDEIRSVC